MRKVIGVTAMLSVFVAFPAMSQDVSQEIRQCSVVTNSVMRLGCFDAIASKIQKTADSAAKDKLGVTETNSSWDVSVSQSKIDDSTNVFVRTVSLEPVRARFGDPSRPVLILRCMENTTAAIIRFQDMFMADIQGYGDVTFRLDKNKAFERYMRASTDNHALGLWSGSSAIPFIKGLFGGETLLVKATPFNESPVTFSFDVAGIEEAIQPLRKACNW